MDDNELLPVDVLHQWLSNAAADLMEVTSRVGNVTDAAELWRLLAHLRDVVKHALAACEDELVSLAHVAISDAGGVLEVDGVQVEASWQAGRTSWDSPRLVSMVAARCSDMAVDRDTGEVLPPSVFAEKVALKVATCLGGLTASASWRTNPLSEMGVDPDDFRSREPGRRKVDVKRARPNAKEAAA